MAQAELEARDVSKELEGEVESYVLHSHHPCVFS